MKRHIIFEKNSKIANALLGTGKCTNEGNWLFTCNDNIEDMKVLQNAVDELTKGTAYKNYKLVFANENNYSDFITV